MVGHGSGDVEQLERGARADLDLQLDLVTAEQQRGGGHQADPWTVVRAVGDPLGPEQAAGQVDAACRSRVGRVDPDPGGHSVSVDGAVGVGVRRHRAGIDGDVRAGPEVGQRVQHPLP